MNDPAPSAQRTIFFALRWLFFLVTGAFVVWSFVQVWGEFQASSLEVLPSWVVLSFAFALASIFFQYGAWRFILEDLSSQRLALIPSLGLYLSSQLARYTPGKVGLPAVRVAGAARLEVSKKLMLASLGLELLSWLAVGSVLVVVVACFAPWEELPHLVQSMGRASALSCAILGGISLALLVFYPRAKYPPVVMRLLGRLMSSKAENESQERALSDSKRRGVLPFPAVVAHLLHWICWLGLGLSSASALGASPGAALWASVALNAAVLGGFLALFAPGGAGVREAVIVQGSRSFLGAGMALA
ncbi:MAG: flippase-like domain-containing protein, partial [Polyangiaceae bacterium]|nr:flippase-like domain-containing protein [Polyangiaceae bacterium]